MASNSTNEMRQEAEWMVPSDDKILELIREYGNLTPTAIEDLGGPSAGHARNRCPVLAKYGLLERISRGLYGITEEGEAYLNEELDASELEPTEDSE
ncbi:PhiH1 repressor [Natrialba swarupiae]|uniref:PhiH1 repressor n=2 Tax=Natrialba swarupiae TaxID=2448032 RepID=A0A5D5AQT2_9EURY|nr:PhiH1 repressor [Natrialba swarupiae]